MWDAAVLKRANVDKKKTNGYRHSRALHLVTTGATYPAKHALLNTLFSETLDSREAVLPRALELAADIVANTSTVSTSLMRDLMYRGPGSAEGAHLLDSRLIYDMFSSADNREGIDAFLQKRDVRFSGSLPKDAPTAYPWWDNVETIKPRVGAALDSKL